MLKRILLIALMVTVVVFVTACGSDGKEEPVAIVNGMEVSRASFDDELDYFVKMYEAQGYQLTDEDHESLREHALDNLINTALLLAAAEEADITADDVDVQGELENTISLFESEEEFEEALAAEGYTRESYADMLTESLIIHALFEEKLDFESIEISNEDIQELFEIMQEQYAELDQEIEFEDVEEYLVSQLREQEEGALISDYLEQLREESDIEILDF